MPEELRDERGIVVHPKWAVLPVGGELETRGGTHSLADLQHEVGGYVEHIAGPHGEDLWINEEGKLEGLRMNAGATQYLRKHGRIMPGDYIAGSMVISAISEKRWQKLREEFPEGTTVIIPNGFTIVRV